MWFQKPQGFMRNIGVFSTSFVRSDHNQTLPPPPAAPSPLIKPPACRGRVRELPPPLAAQIKEDFEHWQKITLQHVEQAYCGGAEGNSFRIQASVGQARCRLGKAWCSCDPFFRTNLLQIIDGRMYIVGETPNFETRNWNTVTQLFRASVGHVLPDVDMVVRWAAAAESVHGRLGTQAGSRLSCNACL